jgi:hypothetical protein
VGLVINPVDAFCLIQDDPLMVKDTWFARELPILEAVVQLDEDTGGRPIRLDAIADAADRPFDEALTSIRRLNTAGYIEVGWTLGNGGRGSHVDRISAEALRAVGAWPNPENLAIQLLAEMEKAAEAEPDPDKRGRLRAAATVLGETLRGSGEAILASVIAKALGLSA